MAAGDAYISALFLGKYAPGGEAVDFEGEGRTTSPV
jgi:hypothetical protein